MARHGARLFVGWLLLSALLVTVLFGAGRWFVEENIRERLGEHLLLTLDESLFSIEPPAGYTVQTVQVDASQPMEKDLITLLRQYSTLMNNALPEADAHYAGKGVSLGAPGTPIFWYRPKDAKKYRVIYADLSVREADTPPDVSKAQPVPAASDRKE